MKKLNRKKPLSRAAEEARRRQAEAEETYNARVKFERLIAQADALNAYEFGPLVTNPETVDHDGEGVFEPEELARIPSQQLYHSLLYLEQTQEILETLIEHIREVLDARDD